MATMRAAVIHGLGDFKIEDVQKPEPQHGEIVIEVKCVTTCGTDVKSYVRGRPGDRYPRLFGHGEVAGIVHEVGEGVKKFKVGDRVTAHNSATCLECEPCLRHKYQACENRTFAVDNPTAPLGRGGYQEYYLVPDRIVRYNAFHIPDDVADEAACQLEPSCCAVYGSHLCQTKPGDSVVILGSGPQAIYHLQMQRMMGAIQVIMTDLVDWRLQKAKEFGADHVLNAGKVDVEEEIKNLTDGKGPDIVIEAIGTPATYEQAVRIVGKLGLVNHYAGAKPGTTITLDTGKIHYGGITIVGTNHTTPYHTHLTWRLICAGRLNTKDVCTQKMPLKDLHKAFEILTGPKNALKIGMIP